MTEHDRALLQRLVDAHEAAERLARALKVARIERDQAERDARHLLDAKGCSFAPSLTEKVREARRLLDMNAPRYCTTCGKPVERARRCYATPTCYACLPPPRPLPVVPPPGKIREAVEKARSKARRLLAEGGGA